MSARSLALLAIVLAFAPWADAQSSSLETIRSRGVLRVHELDIARGGLVARNGDGDRLRPGLPILFGAVAGLAPGLRGRLVVADGTAARAFEGESSRAGAGLVTHETRELHMTRVWKGVGRGPDGETNVGVTLLRRRDFRRVWHWRIAGVEGEWTATVGPRRGLAGRGYGCRMA